MDTDTGRDRAQRIATFNILPFAYRVVADWAGRHGHDLALVMTTSGPASRRNVAYREIVAGVPPTHEVVVTSNVGRLAALVSDLLVSFTFLHLIPPAIAAIPRLGAINLHPTPLPRYRGPNPLRQIYDGAITLGATLHRTEAGFDTGAILSQQARPPLDKLTTERLGAALAGVSAAALEERAALRRGGRPPRLGCARSPPAVLRVALLVADHEPQIVLDGVFYAIRSARPTAGPGPVAAPGGMIARADDTWMVGVADGAVEIVLGALVRERPVSIS